MATAAQTQLWRDRVLALAAGALPALAFPEPSVWVLGLVGLVPLMYLVGSAPTQREAVWRVWAGGIGYFIAVHHWLVPVTGPFVVPLAMVLALLWIPWGLALWLIIGREQSPARLMVALLVVPSAWVVAEYLRSWDRLGGPWGLLGATQWQNLPLLAVVSVGGVWLLSFLLVAVNVAISSALFREAQQRQRILAGVVALLLIGAGYLAVLVQPAYEPTASFAVAGVQPGDIKGGTARLDAQEALTRTLVGSDLDLVVWAESSVGTDLTPGSARLERLQTLAADVGAPILLNVDSRRDDGGIYKASVLIDGNGIEDRYDKMRLVPFGEYVPIRPLFGWVTSVTDAADEDRKRGESLVVMDVNGVAIGPLVCFESAFPDLSRSLVDMGADVIVLQTATTTFQGSWAQPQHASLAAVRAVETARPMVHAALSGVSAVFAADGSRLTTLGSDEVGTWQASPGLSNGTTIYVRTGDWAPVLAALVLLGSGAFLALRQARRSRPLVDSPR